MTDSTKAFAVVDRLLAEKIISKYAIGGALAALYYLEPTNTEDIDVFIHLVPAAGSSLLSIGPLIERLNSLGYSEWRGENIVVEGWPIQFLPATNPLEMEALEKATRFADDAENPYVFSAEYLMAICLELFRPKDKVRLEQFHRQGAYNRQLFESIIKAHGLEAKWNNLLRLFEAGPSMLM